MVTELTISQARRVALAAQGFAGQFRRSASTPNTRSILRVVNQVRLLQLDSVNVLTRSHYLPVFSRLGPYATHLLDRAAWAAPHQLIEYWGHAACLMPIESQPLLRWRMEQAANDAWGGMRRISAERPDFVSRVLAGVAEHGPVTSGQLEKYLEDEIARPSGPWWDWRDTKVALEWLFWSGKVTTATRRGFERHYDLTERVVPAEILAQPTPSPADAQRELLRRAAQALGVATEADLRDYFRLGVVPARTALRELVEVGELHQVRVSGWRQLAYLHKDAHMPARVTNTALISPFDSLVWYRERALRLWDFRYRLEFYTPQPKRIHGYYVLPFLLGDRLRARVDVKADRQASTLLVHAAYLEEGQSAGEVSTELAGCLRELADWLALSDIRLGDRGDLTGELRKHLSMR